MSPPFASYIIVLPETVKGVDPIVIVPSAIACRLEAVMRDLYIVSPVRLVMESDSVPVSPNPTHFTSTVAVGPGLLFQSCISFTSSALWLGRLLSSGR